VGNGGPFSVTVDNPAPGATGIQAANHTGGTVSAPDIGDTLTLTTGELIDPNSVLAGWDGTSINVVVRAHTQGNKTDFQIWNSTNTTRLNLGNIATGSKFTANNGDATFGATGTASTLVATSSSPFTFTLTLGTAGGSAILADTG